jgi:hypothetical protein
MSCASGVVLLVDPDFLPIPSPNKKHGVLPPKATSHYLSAKELKKHLATDSFASNTNFEAVHRYLSVFINVIDWLTDPHNLDCQNRGGDPNKKFTLCNLVEEAYASFPSQVPPSAHSNHSINSDDSKDVHSHDMDIKIIHDGEGDDPAAPAVTLTKSQKKRAKKQAKKSIRHPNPTSAKKGIIINLVKVPINSHHSCLYWCSLVPWTVHEGFILCKVFLGDSSVICLEVLDYNNLK